jgi:DNA-binding MarR family transcriptional regulator
VAPTKKEYERAARLREELIDFLSTTERITRKHGLTLERYQLLLMVKTAHDGDERASLAELRERLQLAQSSLVELVHRAETLGLVTRELSPRNRRAVYVALTNEGEQRLAAVVTELSNARDRLRASLTNILATVEEGTSSRRRRSPARRRPRPHSP